MAKIKDIYKNDEYGSFLYFCEEHGFFEMADLVNCPFQELGKEADITTSIVSRIKTIFVLYNKSHPDEFAVMKRPSRKSGKSAAPKFEVEKELERYFQNNSDRLLKIADISKSIGKKVKRSDLVQILEDAPWCKAVDSTTFFYSPKA